MASCRCIVKLNRSTRPSLCRCNGVVRIFSMPRRSHIAAKTLASKLRPWSLWMTSAVDDPLSHWPQISALFLTGYPLSSVHHLQRTACRFSSTLLTSQLSLSGVSSVAVATAIHSTWALGQGVSVGVLSHRSMHHSEAKRLQLLEPACYYGSWKDISHWSAAWSVLMVKGTPQR